MLLTEPFVCWPHPPYHMLTKPAIIANQTQTVGCAGCIGPQITSAPGSLKCGASHPLINHKQTFTHQQKIHNELLLVRSTSRNCDDSFVNSKRATNHFIVPYLWKRSLSRLTLLLAEYKPCLNCWKQSPESAHVTESGARHRWG